MTVLLRSILAGGLALVLAVVLGSAGAMAQKAAGKGAKAGKEPTALELLNKTDDLYRGLSSIAVVKMNVKTKRWNRSLELHMWSKGQQKSLIRIAKPKKEAGVTTLKVGKNVWNYLPKVDRVMKVPSSMMSGSWMGSHFSNDDLVRDSRFENAYTFAITKRPADGGGKYIIEATPKPNAPVVWGKVIVEVDGKSELPTEQRFYDEKGRLMRKMTYSDIRDAGGGRMVPMRMRLEPSNKPGEYTEIIQTKLKLDVDIPDEKFSLQALKR